MSLTFIRHRLVQRFIALVMLVLISLSAAVPAGAEIAVPKDGGGGGGGFSLGVCKPPPLMCLSKEAKEKWAKDNHCKWPEDICSNVKPADDDKGAGAADQGFWGSMWDGIKGGLVYGYEFVKGLLTGLKDQIADLYHMITNIDEVVGGLIQLGKAFFTDPVGTMKMVGEMLGQSALDTITKATQCGAYDLGKVIGGYVSPAFALKIAGKLTKFGGKLAEASKALKHDFGCASFGAGTLVSTPGGLSPIERILVGQTVLSRNETSYADRPQLVTEVFGRVAPSYRLLSTESDSFKVTDEHPLWVQGKGWIEASQVVTDDVISSVRGDLLVKSNVAVQQPLRVYNFSVANTTSYFVGNGGMWAHNSVCSIEMYSKAWKHLLAKEKGFNAEHDVFLHLEKHNFDPVGNSFNPKGMTPEQALKAWDGQTGIDGIYKNKATGKYVIVESKATGAPGLKDPANCKGKLCKMTTGERQMSEKWIEDRLTKAGITGKEAEDIMKSITDNDGMVQRVYAQTNENGTVYNIVKSVGTKDVIMGGIWTP